MNNGSKFSAELVLEFIKVFIWPVLLVTAILIYHDTAIDIIKNRKWKVGIVEVGDRVVSLEKAVQEQLIYQKDYLVLIKEHSAEPEMVNEYADLLLSSLKNTQIGISNEVRTIETSIRSTERREPVNETASERHADENEPTTAIEWENAGFKYLLSKDIDNALNAFTESEKIWPIYHNVAEIRALLNKEKMNLKAEDAIEWKHVYKKILSEYSWGVPYNIRQQMQSFVEKTP